MNKSRGTLIIPEVGQIVVFNNGGLYKILCVDRGNEVIEFVNLVTNEEFVGPLPLPAGVFCHFLNPTTINAIEKWRDAYAHCNH